jgi:hypothetical protein
MNVLVGSKRSSVSCGRNYTANIIITTPTVASRTRNKNTKSLQEPTYGGEVVGDRDRRGIAG